MKLPSCFMVSESDGGLYDTRKPGWYNFPPIRANYSRHFSDIKTTSELKATLRAGGFAWPGGYSIAIITTDGGALCFDCAHKNIRSMFWSLANKCNDGWCADCLQCTSECDEEIICDNCNKAI